MGRFSDGLLRGVDPRSKRRLYNPQFHDDPAAELQLPRNCLATPWQLPGSSLLEIALQ